MTQSNNLKMSKELSILMPEPEKRLEALKKSRLQTIVKDPELFARICEAGAMLLTSDKIRACDEESVMGALYKAATMGFRLEPEFGECYLIPRSMKVGGEWKSVCCFQIGYKGWKAMALQSGHINYLQAREVYKDDEFAFKQGTSSFLDHTQAEENNGVTTHFYAIARLATGEYIFEVINKQAAEKSRKNSESQYDWVGGGSNKTKVYSETPKDVWLKNYAPMALRVPIKRLCSSLPLTPAIERAIEADGGVTYLQKDGTLTTISPVEVEVLAEKSEGQASAVSVEHIDTYHQVGDALASFTSFTEVKKYYAEFQSGDLYLNDVFVRLFYERAAQVATKESQLKEFWDMSGKWHKVPSLTKIISQRKSELESETK